jgi:uncharacterized protein (TIGR02266 family)
MSFPNQSSQLQSPAVQADRRRTLRRPLIVQRVKAEDERRTFFGYASNISSGGLFIGTANPKDVGSRFVVEIPLPEPIARQIRCSCEVVWMRPWQKRMSHEPGMGLRFLDLAEGDRDAIDRWIESCGDRETPWRVVPG